MRKPAHGAGGKNGGAFPGGGMGKARFRRAAACLCLLCRNEATRTPDPYVPNVVRYQLRYIPICFCGANVGQIFQLRKDFVEKMKISFARGARGRRGARNRGGGAAGDAGKLYLCLRIRF